MADKRKILYGSAAVIILLFFSSCSLLPGGLEQGAIALKIGVPSGSRAIVLKEYDVESLDVTVTGPGGDILKELQWLPPDSIRCLIPGVGPGTYTITVTHNGVNGDSELSVTEEETFELKVMKITTVTVIPGLLASLFVENDQDDPIDLTGFWTASWNMPGMEITPLYTHLEQTGSEVLMPYGFSGTVVGNTFINSGYIEGMGDLAGTGVIEGDYISGPFEITDPYGNVIEGTSTMVRTDSAILGHMDVCGNTLDTDMDFSTESARAEVSVGESDWAPSGYSQTLYIGYTTASTDIGFWIERDTASGPLGVGDFAFADGTEMIVHVRYLVDGAGFDEMNSTGSLIFSGTLHISKWVDDVGFSGSITGSGLGGETLDVIFDLPFSPPAAF
ncbi:MAG: hypothetical protein KAH21_05910 [Spirochaetaceae bacterium]|nr:hypothetical protein [Spirochaetaceae bacterium]